MSDISPERFFGALLRGIIAEHDIKIEVDTEMMVLRIHGWNVSNEQAWELLSGPLAYALYELAQTEHHPAVSYRNFHALSAALARPATDDPRDWATAQDDELVILIGGNNSPWSGVQRRCAERAAAFRALFLGLAVFGAVTAIERQVDDITGIQSRSGIRLTCDDCRAELSEDFGWPYEVWMLFVDILDPTIRESTTYGAIVEQYRPHDEAAVRKAHTRA